MTSRIENIRAKINRKVRYRFDRIYCTAKQGLFNFRCFENCVQFVIDSGKDLKIYEVIYIDGDDPCLHYVVKDGDEFQEVTIGWRAEHVEYYLIREVPKEDFKCIGAAFECSLSYWHLEYTNWFDRNILGIDRVC